jgi:hypothetical protein
MKKVMNCGVKRVGDSDLPDAILSPSAERTEENHKLTFHSIAWKIFETCSPELQVNRRIVAGWFIFI